MAVVEGLVLASVVVGLLYWYVTKNNDYWAKRGIAYQKPVFLAGNILDTFIGKRSPGQIHADIYANHPGEKVVGMFNMLKPALLIRDPALCQQILTTDFTSFSTNDFEVDEDVDPVLASNIFIQTGETWKRNRQALSPAFTVSRIKAGYDKIQMVNDKLIKFLEANPETDLKPTISLYTSEIVAAWGMGIDGHSFDSSDPILPRLGKMMFQPSILKLILFITLTFFPLFAKIFRIRFVPQEVPDFFNGVVRDLIETRSNSEAQPKDFLQYFIELRNKRAVSKNDDQNDVTDKNIMNAIVSFFIEGYETSSAVLSLLLFELTNNQDLQKQLRNDVDSLFEKGTPSYEDIIDLPSLNRIYSETVRHYGAPSLGKKCTQDIKLDLGNGRSLLIEKGTSIVVPLAGVQMDPVYWGPNAAKFDPSRWTDDFTPTKGAFLPFGDGPRQCIGMRIASTIIKTAVVNIVRNFELLRTKKTAAKFVQEPKHFLPMQKGGIFIRFSKRTHN